MKRPKFVQVMYAMRHPNQRKVELDWPEFIFCGRFTVQFVVHHEGFCIMWPSHVVGPTQYPVFDELASLPRGSIKYNIQTGVT